MNFQLMTLVLDDEHNVFTRRPAFLHDEVASLFAVDQRLKGGLLRATGCLG